MPEATICRPCALDRHDDCRRPDRCECFWGACLSRLLRIPKPREDP